LYLKRQQLLAHNIGFASHDKITRQRQDRKAKIRSTNKDRL